MDPFVMRAVGRGLQVVAAIGLIIYGIVLMVKHQGDEEKEQKAYKRGKACIWGGIVILGLLILRIMM
jgi:uncharacterized membrane protein